MTIPDERTRAVMYADEFLRDLLDPKKTPKVPKAIRIRAGRILRHFPWYGHMHEAAIKSPEVFGVPVKPEDLDFTKGCTRAKRR